MTVVERRELAQRLELALARAGRRGLFRPSCLVHSMALVAMLARHGAPGAVIRLGVRPGGRGDLGGMRSGDAGSPGGTDAVTVGGAAGDSGTPQVATRVATIEAHAWVELDGLTLDGGTGHVRRFTPLGSVRAVAASPDGR